MTKEVFNWMKVATVVACLIVSCVMYWGCGKDDNGEKSITISNSKDLKQTAYADEETTGKGFTFTAKSEWTASVKEVTSLKSSNVPWVMLLCNGVETYSGDAGTFTITIVIKPNSTGKSRSANITITSDNDKITISITQDEKTKSGEIPNSEPVELKSPIRENTTLKYLGKEVDYIYAGNSYNPLTVENNATLTIEPGVTIKFTDVGKSGGITIKGGATIKAIGTATKHIRFIGIDDSKGSWRGINLETNSDNQFVYCDFLNAGNSTRTDGGSGLYVYNANVGISHCKFSNGLGYGINMTGDNNKVTAFDHNVVEDYDLAPVRTTGNNKFKVLEKLDMTSDFTNNKNLYIEIYAPYHLLESATLNQTTVPYYFNGAGVLSIRNCTFTINEGVTIYMASNQAIQGSSGRLLINGTATKKVKITRLPGGGDYYWQSVSTDALPESVIKNCILEYGGQLGVTGILYIDTYSNLTLENVEINNSNTYGARLGRSFSLTHKNVTFKNNRECNVYYYAYDVAEYCCSPHFP